MLYRVRPNNLTKLSIAILRCSLVPAIGSSSANGLSAIMMNDLKINFASFSVNSLKVLLVFFLLCLNKANDIGSMKWKYLDEN